LRSWGCGTEVRATGGRGWYVSSRGVSFSRAGVVSPKTKAFWGTVRATCKYVLREKRFVKGGDVSRGQRHGPVQINGVKKKKCRGKKEGDEENCSPGWNPTEVAFLIKREKSDGTRKAEHDGEK